MLVLDKKKREGYSSKKRDSWQVCNNIVCKTSYYLHQAGDLIELCRVIVTPYLCHVFIKTIMLLLALSSLLQDRSITVMVGAASPQVSAYIY